MAPAVMVAPTAVAASEVCDEFHENNGIYLFSDINQGGTCSFVPSQYADLRTSLIGNDTLSSLTVHAKGSKSALLYRDINFTGPCQVVTGGLNSLVGQPIGNDQVSSVRMVESSGWTTVTTADGPRCTQKKPL